MSTSLIMIIVGSALISNDSSQTCIVEHAAIELPGAPYSTRMPTGSYSASRPWVITFADNKITETFYYSTSHRKRCSSASTSACHFTEFDSSCLSTL